MGNIEKIFLGFAFTLVFGGLTLHSCTAEAGMFASVITSSWEEKQPNHKYKLETYGYDVRVYEWTPKDNPNVRCVFVAGNENATGVACYQLEDNSGQANQRERR